MKELLESITAGLDLFGELTERVLNAISLFFIVAGTVVALIRTFRDRRRLSKVYPAHLSFRMVFGGWLVVALEFQLAADIVGTIVSPGTEHLVELGAIALIRTFLNYFLNKELNEEMEISRKAAKAEGERIV